MPARRAPRYKRTCGFGGLQFTVRGEPPGLCEMTLKQLGLAMVLGGGCLLAAANNTYTFTMPLAPAQPYTSTVTVVGGGPFTDLWNFTAPAGAAAVSGSAISVDIHPWFDIDDMLIELYETQGNRLIATGTGTAGSSISEIPVIAGTPYYFQVTGDVTGAASGVYSFLAIAALVPEPPTHAIWLAGLAVVGFLVSRRHSPA
jgi:hypothetical protein